MNDQRVSRLDQIAGSELARGLEPRGASHRPDPMSTSLYSALTSPSSGAALVGAGDREAPHPHSVTTQREREAMLHHADEQSPPPSPLAASQRSCRPKLSRARRKLIGASHVSVCYNTCRSLSITCSVSANNTLPMGRDGSSVFAQMTWRPLGTGKRFHQH